MLSEMRKILHLNFHNVNIARNACGGLLCIYEVLTKRIERRFSMAVRVLIKRQMKRGISQDVLALLNKLRSGAMNRDGYVTGESLLGIDDPRKLLVISTWQDMDSWKSWKEDPSRMESENELKEYLEGPTEYEAYALGMYHH